LGYNVKGLFYYKDNQNELITVKKINDISSCFFSNAGNIGDYFLISVDGFLVRGSGMGSATKHLRKTEQSDTLIKTGFDIIKYRGYSNAPCRVYLSGLIENADMVETTVTNESLIESPTTIESSNESPIESSNDKFLGEIKNHLKKLKKIGDIISYANDTLGIEIIPDTNDKIWDIRKAILDTVNEQLTKQPTE
jgi:hypothetical protein